MASNVMQYITPMSAQVAGEYAVDTTGNGTINIDSNQTLVINIPFSFQRSATSGMGGTLTSMTVSYSTTADLASVTGLLQTITFNPTPVFTTIPSSLSGFTLIAGSYVGTVTPISPVVDNSAVMKQYRLQLTIVIGNSATRLTYFGSNLFWTNIVYGGNSPNVSFTVGLSPAPGVDFPVSQYANASAAFTAATAALPGTGGVIKILPGTYTITSPIILNDHVKLIGSGYSTYLQLNTTTNSAIIQSFNFNTYSGSGQNPAFGNIEISNMTIDGNKQNNTVSATYLVQLYGLCLVLRDLIIRNGKVGGLWTEYGGGSPTFTPTMDAVGSVFRNIRIHTCGNIQWQFSGPHDSWMDEIKIFSTDNDVVNHIRGGSYNMSKLHTNGNVSDSHMLITSAVHGDCEVDTGNTIGAKITSLTPCNITVRALNCTTGVQIGTSDHVVNLEANGCTTALRIGNTQTTDNLVCNVRAIDCATGINFAQVTNNNKINLWGSDSTSNTSVPFTNGNNRGNSVFQWLHENTGGITYAFDITNFPLLRGTTGYPTAQAFGNVNVGLATCGQLTFTGMTNAAGTAVTCTVSSTAITTISVVTLSVNSYVGTGANGIPVVSATGITTGQFTLVVANAHSANALSGTIGIGFNIIN